MVYIQTEARYLIVFVQKLLLKLRVYSINSNICSWVEQFTKYRLQRVVVNEYMSGRLHRTISVPQGVFSTVY